MAKKNPKMDNEARERFNAKMEELKRKMPKRDDADTEV